MEEYVINQIVLNIFYVFVLPFLVGGTVRFLLCNFSKAWIFTAVVAAASVVACVVALNPPVGGSELYGIITYQCAEITISSFVVGLILRQKRKSQ